MPSKSRWKLNASIVLLLSIWIDFCQRSKVVITLVFESFIVYLACYIVLMQLLQTLTFPQYSQQRLLLGLNHRAFHTCRSNHNRRTKQEQSQARLSYALQGGGRA